MKFLLKLSLLLLTAVFLVSNSHYAFAQNNSPCETDLDCLRNRYPREYQSCDLNSCDCESLINSIEYPITSGNANIDRLQCANEKCAAIRTGSQQIMSDGSVINPRAVLCYREDAPRHTVRDNTCRISSSTTNKSVQIEAYKLMIGDTYTVETYYGDKIFTTRSFKVDDDTNLIKVLLNSSDYPEDVYSIGIRVLATDGNSLCTGTVNFIADSDMRSPIKGTPFDYCSQLPGTEDDFDDPNTQRGACWVCVTQNGKFEGPEDSGKIYTGLGCISVSNEGLAKDLIRLLLGVSGGIALISILSASFMLTISQGDSNKVKNAKELITASITGLLFLIFSIFILEFIGVDILHIPDLY